MTEAVSRQPDGAAAPAEPMPWPSPRLAWYVVFVLSLTLFINFLDRNILNLLVGDIKADLRLSDTQWALVSGFAFAALYAVVGLPIARLVDSQSRRTIIGVGLVLWSLMTAATGLARNFGQLFGIRVGVGVGEACTGPATFSILSDYFPREKLSRAIGVLQLGYMTGTGLALIVGGTIIHFVSQMGDLGVPFFDALRPWQKVMMMVGVPGLLVAAMMITVPEPVRRDANGRPVAAARSIPVAEVVRYLVANGSTYGPMFLGLALKTVMSFGATIWTPAFYMRTFHWTPVKVGLVGGTISLLVAPLGTLFGVWLAERWTRQGHHDATLRVVAWSSLCLFPVAGLFPLMPTEAGAIAMAVGVSFISSWVLGPQNAALQSITPNRMRGQITAIWLFIFNVIGFGMGPSLVAALTDHVFRSEAHLNWSLSTVAFVLGPIATLIIWLGLKPFGRTVAALEAS